MPTILNIPFTQEEFKEDEEAIINVAVHKNQEPTLPLSISLVFHGIPISSETQVVAQIEKPIFTLVRELRQEIAKFAQSATNHPTSAAAIKLSFVGVTLQDEKERISHVVKRILKDRHLSNPSLLKIFVSLDQNSRLVQQQQQNDFPTTTTTHLGNAMNGALRRDRENSSSNNNGEMNMSVEQADAMANMMASNPQMIEAMLNADPTMREMMRTNPEFARQMRDPDTLRQIFRGQFSRQGRVMQDNEQRAALSFIQNHPEGNALIERALGREGILTENGEGSMFSVTGGAGNSLADDAANNLSSSSSANNERGPLLPPTTNNNLMGNFLMNNNNNNINPFASIVPRQQQQLYQVGNDDKKEKIKALVKTLTEEMGFDAEIAELAANEANGELEKALTLLEEWQN